MQMIERLTYGACVGLMALVATVAANDVSNALPGVAGSAAPAVPDADPDAAAARMIDLAICLDTSGSMDGLIDSARQKLWAIVNDLALAEPTPQLRVALLTFGNDGHLAENGWVEVQTPFTNDLDLVSSKLFALKTNGGTEFVGRVLHRAGELDWHPSDDALKLAIVAGNESADQDEARPFRDVCRALITNGIMVNSIYCGPATDQLAPAWKEVALLADGKFASIDQNEGTIVIETPFDDALNSLSTALNATYIPYGAKGEWGVQQQVVQDANAANLNTAAAAARCVTKGSALYCNSAWDLVDAAKGADFDLAAIKIEDLPEDLQEMTPGERAAYVEEMTRQRASVQKEITGATAKREAYIAEEMKRQSLDDSRSFDRVIRRAIRQQAESKGFTFPRTGVE